MKALTVTRKDLELFARHLFLIGTQTINDINKCDSDLLQSQVRPWRLVGVDTLKELIELGSYSNAPYRGASWQIKYTVRREFYYSEMRESGHFVVPNDMGLFETANKVSRLARSLAVATHILMDHGRHILFQWEKDFGEDGSMTLERLLHDVIPHIALLNYQRVMELVSTTEYDNRGVVHYPNGLCDNMYTTLYGGVDYSSDLTLRVYRLLDTTLDAGVFMCGLRVEDGRIPWSDTFSTMRQYVSDVGCATGFGTISSLQRSQHSRKQMANALTDDKHREELLEYMQQEVDSSKDQVVDMLLSGYTDSFEEALNERLPKYINNYSRTPIGVFDITVTVASRGEKLGFYRTITDRINDKLTIMKAGRAIKAVNPELKDEEVADIVVKLKGIFDDFFNLEVGIATSRDMCRKVYMNGPRSCMRGVIIREDLHPAEVYAGDEGADFGVAYMEDTNRPGRYTARCIVMPEKKVFFEGTMYGNCQRLGIGLRNAGYSAGSYDDCDGARLNRIVDDGVIVMPYLDLPEDHVQDEGDYMVINRYGNPAHSTNGYSTYAFCQHCDGGIYSPDEEYTVHTDICDENDTETWCEGCRNDSATWVNGYSRYYADDLLVRCDYTGELAHPDDLIEVYDEDGDQRTIIESSEDCFRSAHGYPPEPDEYEYA